MISTPTTALAVSRSINGIIAVVDRETCKLLVELRKAWKENKNVPRLMLFHLYRSVGLHLAQPPLFVVLLNEAFHFVRIHYITQPPFFKRGKPQLSLHVGTDCGPKINCLRGLYHLHHHCYTLCADLRCGRKRKRGPAGRVQDVQHRLYF